MHRIKLSRGLILLIVLSLTGSTLSAQSPVSPMEPPLFARQWGGLGQSPGQFFMPWGIAIGPDDRIYVSDYGNNRIQVFSPEGDFLKDWGRVGSAPGQFLGPVGLAVGPDGTVYVADAGNHRVQAFSAAGEFLRSWRGPSQGEHPFRPWGVAVDTQSQVYITDLQANMIYKFSDEGQLLLSWGGFGTQDGKFTGPTGIAVSPDDKVYIVDSLGYRIQAFTSNGQFLFKWGSLCDLYIHPGLSCKDPDGVGPLASGDGQLSSPWGIAFDALGRVYIADSANKRIQVFTSEGEFLLKWGRLGRNPGEFDNPVGVALDRRGDIYVTDLNNNRIQKFAFARSTPVPTSPPTITAIEVPPQIAVGDFSVKGTVNFQDPDGDIREARFRVIDGKYDPFAVRLDDLFGWTKGSFSFELSCSISQQVTLKLVLVDRAGHASEPKGFSFTCGAPPLGNYDEEQTTVRPTQYTLGVNLFLLADGAQGLSEGAIFLEESAVLGQPRSEVRVAIEQQVLPAVTGIWDQCGVEFTLQNLVVVRPEQLQLSRGNLDRLLFVRERTLPEIAISDARRERPLDLLEEALSPLEFALRAGGRQLDSRALNVFITGARIVLQPGDERHFGGVTHINGRVSLVRWDDILVIDQETGEIFPPKRPITAIAHEFGHNFGLQHTDQQGIPAVAQDPLNLMLSNTRQPTAVPPQPAVNLLPIQCMLSAPTLHQLNVRSN